MPTQACLQRQREGRRLGFRGQTLSDPMDCSTPGFPVHHHSQSLLKFMSIASVVLSNQLGWERGAVSPKPTYLASRASPSPLAHTVDGEAALFDAKASGPSLAPCLA